MSIMSGYMIKLNGSLTIFVLVLIVMTYYVGYATIICDCKETEKEIKNLKKKLEEKEKKETEAEFDFFDKMVNEKIGYVQPSKDLNNKLQITNTEQTQKKSTKEENDSNKTDFNSVQ